MQASTGRSSTDPAEVPVAHFTTTRATKILAVDDATATLLQRSARALVGKPLAVLVDVGDRSSFRARVADLAEDRAIRDWHLRLQAPDGAAIAAIATVEVLHQPFIDGNETNLGWSMVAARDAPLLATDAMEQLTGELVHELNQPLAAIISYARGCVLRSSANNLSAEVLETAMERIVAEAMRASALLRATAERWRQK